MGSGYPNDKAANGKGRTSTVQTNTKTTTTARRGRDAACARIGCPILGEADRARCASCPGPDFFTRHHECGKCRLNGKGDPRCIVCAGPSDTPSHKGASHVSIDAMPDGGERMLRTRLDTKERHTLAGLSDAEVDAARRMLLFFASLELDEFALVKHLLAGGNLNTYASINNKPRQYVWKMAKRMMEKSPEARCLVKERKQPNGRVLVRDKASPLQMTLF